MWGLLWVLGGCTRTTIAPPVVIVTDGGEDTGAPVWAEGCPWSGEWVVEGAWCSSFPQGQPEGWTATFGDLEGAARGCVLTVDAVDCVETFEMSEPESSGSSLWWTVETDDGCGEGDSGALIGPEEKGFSTYEDEEKRQFTLMLFAVPAVFEPFDPGCPENLVVKLVPTGTPPTP